MRTNIFTLIIVLLSVFCAYPQKKEHTKFIYQHTTEQLRDKYSKQHMAMAQRAVQEMDSVIYNGKYKADFGSLSQHETPEWFMDAKFGIAVNYGFYSVAGTGYQSYGGSYYTDIYGNYMYNEMRDYHVKTWGADFERDDFIPLFTAKLLDADKYMKLFKDAGAKYFTLFMNHRSTGMLLWDSKYTFRDSKDMTPQRDLTGEFSGACKKYDIPFCAYFNFEDTDYPIINPADNELYVREWTKIKLNTPPPKANSYEVLHKYDPGKERRRLQGKVPVYDYINDYYLPIAKEIIDKYDPSYLWFDGAWKRPVWYYKSTKIVAYFYNINEGKKEVIVNCRMGYDQYGKLGDVRISEGGSTDDDNVPKYWEEITPMGRNFAYDFEDNGQSILSSKELIHMLIKIVAKGGNLLLIVAPDGDGRIPDYQVSRLKDIGEWLAINGEAIYETRPHPYYSEEDNIGLIAFYTQSKDEKYTYAIAHRFHNFKKRIMLYNVCAKEGSEIKLLGYEGKLDWFNSDWGLNILLPDEVLNNLPCKFAWVFKFEEDASKEILKMQNDD